LAIKYLATGRLQGTTAERTAMITHVSLNYSSILGSPYSPNFFLKLNEGTGTAVTNSGSTSGYTASITASGVNPTWSDGVTGNSGSLKFAESSTVKVGMTQLPTENTQNFTMGFTFKIPTQWTGGDSNNHHIWQRKFSGLGFWQMNISNNGYITTGWYNNGWQHVYGDRNSMDNAWHTFFLTNNGSSRNIKGYLDGTIEYSTTADRSGYSDNWVDHLGNQGGSGSNILYIDNAFMKTSVLSASDISDLHDLLIPSSTTSTYPNFPEGTIFEDLTDGKHYIWNGSTAWNEMT